MRFFLFAAVVFATPALAQDIVPRDGTWSVRSVEAEMGAVCPPYFEPMAEQMKANAGKRDLYDVSWRGAFNPNRARGLDPEQQGILWVEDGPRTWRANLAGDDKDYVVARMTLLSETEVRNTVNMDVEQMMAEEGGALPDVAGCTLTMTFLLEHKG
ncbi:MAG: hypothetical protein AAFY65_15970 [Pseudomonadota bacterium]